MIKSLVPSLFLIITLVIVSQVSAQEATPQPTETPRSAGDIHSSPDPSPTPVSGPTYIVASGDSLTLIANRFGVTLNDLIDRQRSHGCQSDISSGSH